MIVVAVFLAGVAVVVDVVVVIFFTSLAVVVVVVVVVAAAAAAAVALRFSAYFQTIHISCCSFILFQTLTHQTCSELISNTCGQHSWHSRRGELVRKPRAQKIVTAVCA